MPTAKQIHDTAQEFGEHILLVDPGAVCTDARTSVPLGLWATLLLKDFSRYLESRYPAAPDLPVSPTLESHFEAYAISMAGGRWQWKSNADVVFRAWCKWLVASGLVLVNRDAKES